MGEIINTEDENKGRGFAILTDECPMPYGAYKGQPMKNVPARYLIWLRDNDKCSRSIRAYITDNEAALEKEAGVKPKATHATVKRVNNRRL